MADKKIIVAIDGFSSCGKSTMAKQLAKKVGYIYVDTGAMYRVVTLFAMDNGWIRTEDEKKVVDEDFLKAAIDNGRITVTFVLDELTGMPLACLNGKVVENEIRTMQVSDNVSLVAAIPFVRFFLTGQQQRMGIKKGIVMDGRDIGTAVFPNAELKIFLTASPSVRAQRRFDELRGKGDLKVTLEEVLNNVKERDYIDSHREVAPLRQAKDAIVIDNSKLTKEQQDQILFNYFKQAVNKL